MGGVTIIVKLLVKVLKPYYYNSQDTIATQFLAMDS